MFGILNPTKLLFTIAVVAAIWYGFKWLGRAKALRESDDDKPSRSRNSADAPSSGPATEEMVKCKACGDYVSASRAVSCGRDDCPFPR